MIFKTFGSTGLRWKPPFSLGSYCHSSLGHFRLLFSTVSFIIHVYRLYDNFQIRLMVPCQSIARRNRCPSYVSIELRETYYIILYCVCVYFEKVLRKKIQKPEAFQRPVQFSGVTFAMPPAVAFRRSRTDAEYRSREPADVRNKDEWNLDTATRSAGTSASCGSYATDDAWWLPRPRVAWFRRWCAVDARSRSSGTRYHRSRAGSNAVSCPLCSCPAYALVPPRDGRASTASPDRPSPSNPSNSVDCTCRAY